MPITGRAGQTRRARAWVFLGTLLALGALVILTDSGLNRQQTAPRPTPPSDTPHLVVQGHDQAVSGMLMGACGCPGRSPWRCPVPTP